MEQIRYLTADDVVMANRAAVKGAESVVNFAMLELAIQLPQQEFGDPQTRTDIHMKAGVLMYALIRKPAFSVGNKRTAVLAATLFYAMNGMWWRPSKGTCSRCRWTSKRGSSNPMKRRRT